MTGEIKINLFLSDGKAKVWRKTGTANDPKYTTSSVKHGGGSVMAWECMAVSGTGPLNFNDDLGPIPFLPFSPSPFPYPSVLHVHVKG